MAVGVENDTRIGEASEGAMTGANGRRQPDEDKRIEGYKANCLLFWEGGGIVVLAQRSGA